MARKFVRTQSVEAKETERAAIERSLAIGRETPRQIDLEQAQATEEIAPDLMRTQPYDQFDMADPEDYPAWQSASGFVENLDNPIRAIKEESLPANLIKWLTGKTNEAVEIERKKYRLDPNVAAINNELGALEEAGKQDTPEYSGLLEELEAIEEDLNQSDQEPEFSFAAVKQAFNKDPGAFAAEFANVIAKDPELLVTPIGWRVAATRAGAALTRLGVSAGAAKAGEVAAGAAGTAAAGGAVTGAISAGEQLGAEGEVTDPEQVALDTALGAGASVVLVGAFKGATAAAKKLTPGAKQTPGPKFESEPVEPVVVAAKATPEGELGALGKLIADDVGAAEHGAKIRVVEPVPSLAPGAPIETAAQRAFLKTLTARRQAGRADPKVLAATAFVGLGAAGGAGMAEDPLAGAAGGVAAAVGSIIAGRTLKKLGEGVKNSYKYVTAPDNRIRIDDLTNMHEADIATHYRATWQYKEDIKLNVPEPKQREAISHWLEGDKTKKLSASERATAAEIREAFDHIAKVAKDEGVIESHIEDYVTHFWRQRGQSKSEVVQILSDQLAATGGMGTKTVHAKQRVIPTLQAGIDAGLEPVTLDIAEIYKMYSDGVYRAIRNKQLAQALRDEIAPDGTALVLPAAGKSDTTRGVSAAARRIEIARAKLERIEQRVAEGKSGNVERAAEAVRRAEQSATPPPADYVAINHPQFSGEVVHPDIAPSLNFIYHSSDPNVIARGVLALNFAMKRSLVSMSMFHANALMESMVYAGVSPHKIVPALHQLAHGKAGDIVDEALRSGLKIGTIEDVGSDVFYAALKDIQSVADDIIPVAGGAAVRGVEKLNRVVDDIMWDKIATGGKLAVFMNEMEKAVLNNAAKHAKDPAKNPLIPREQLAAEVSEYVNDAFGGLNWRRIAEGTKTKLGRDIATAAFNPAGRRMMQVLMFAPDWTIANIRVLLKAIPGQAKNKRVARMHQYYAARGAAFFATAGSALNMMYTGKPIWENEDPTTIDMGDGRKMTFSKQFVEPFHWVGSPGKTLINKGGILPKTAIELSKGIKYFSGRASDPPLYADDASMWEKSYANAGLIGKKFTPIFAQQVADQGVSGVAGFLGHPIYGKKLE